MSVDLHLHSCFSDGTCTPEELAAELRAQGVTLAALTDHNTFDGYPRFAAACRELGVDILRGMELDCLFEGVVIHLLAYGFEPAGKLMTFAAHSKQLLLEMSRDLVKRMSREYPQLSLTEYDVFSYEPTGGGWKGLHYLRKKGVIQSLEEGKGLYRQFGCDYSDYPFPSVKAVCGAIRDAGGTPVLAHPGNWYASLPVRELVEKLDALRAAGVGGVECYYPSHSGKLTACCVTYCGQNNLLVTAGNDFHGEFSKVCDGVEYVLGAVSVELSQLRLGQLYRT